MKNSPDIRQDSTFIFPVSWSENDKTKKVEFSTEKMKYFLYLLITEIQGRLPQYEYWNTLLSL